MNVRDHSDETIRHHAQVVDHNSFGTSESVAALSKVVFSMRGEKLDGKGDLQIVTKRFPFSPANYQ